MKTIGLCMIVKNESKVILRCLESVHCTIDAAAPPPLITDISWARQHTE
jgi:hypothetical protein